MKKLVLGVLLSAVLTLPATAASICQGPAPAPGTWVHGPVLQIDDGASFCIAKGAQPSNWSVIRLAAAQTSRSRLMAAAFGKNVTCLIGRDGLAQCAVEGKPLSGELQRSGLVEAALTWR